MRKNKSLFPVFFFSVLFIGLLFVTHSGSTVAQTNSACMDSCYSEFGSCIDNYCTPLTSEVDADACKGQCHQNAAVCEGNCRSATEDVIPDPTPVPSPEEDQETVPQLDYDFTREFESLAGGLARPFDEIFWRTTPIVPKSVRDPQGQEINLDEIAKDWKKVAPIVKVNYPVENIEAGQPVRMELPEGLPLKKALFLTAGPVTYADTEVTIFDGKTTPRLLREEEKGGPIGVDEDEYIEAPNPSKYDMSYYFKVKTTVKNDDEEFHPYESAMFELLPQNDIFPEAQRYRGLKIFRYNADMQIWDNLLSEMDCKSKNNCRIIVKSPGTSLFAVVGEKRVPGFLKVLDLLFLALFLHVIIRRKEISAIVPTEPTYKTRKIILRLVGLILLSWVAVALEFTLIAIVYRVISSEYLGGPGAFISAFFVTLLNMSAYQGLKMRGRDIVFKNPQRTWLNDRLMLLIGTVIMLLILLFAW